MLFDQCLTLEMLAEDFNSNGTIKNASNVSFIFINQNYHVRDNLKLLFIGISVTQLKPWIAKHHVTVYCMGDLSITYSSVRIITIESVEFYDCAKFQPLITFSKTNTTTEMIALINSSFHRSMFGSIHIRGQVFELKVINCLFSANVNDYGVSIESVASADFKNSTFSNNAAGSVMFSGLTAIASSKFRFCYFLNNTSKYAKYGSAINVKIFLLDLSIKHCTFQKSVGPSVRITISLFYSLRYLVGNIEIMNSNFLENEEHFDGDVAIEGILSISVIMSNFSDINGKGSIHVTDVPSVYFEACNFFNNYNNYYDRGGALTLYHSQRVSVIGCNFLFNTAENKGGAFYAEHVTALNIQNCIFSNNSGQEGGALYINHVHLFNMTNCTIKYNKAHGDAGALSIYTNIYRDNVTVSFCTFVGNQAGKNCGVFAGELSYFYISNSNFTTNMANGSGGALIIYSTTLCIYNSIFLKNQASIEGGAIITNTTFITVPQKLIVVNTTLDNNLAMRGGAMAIRSDELHLHSLNFYENHAEQNGGANTGIGGAIYLYNITTYFGL